MPPLPCAPDLEGLLTSCAKGGPPTVVRAAVSRGQMLLWEASAQLPHSAAPAIPATATEEGEQPFLIYSITKTLLAILIMRQVERGRLILDEPLTKTWPSAPAADRITLRQVLQHDSGLPDYGGLAAYHEALRQHPAEAWSAGDFLRETWGGNLLFEPGAGWAYSNLGYMVLKIVLEKVSGRSLGELVQEEIAMPLGLKQTFVVEELAMMAALAPGYSRQMLRTEQPVDVRSQYHPGWVSHGVAASTPTEVNAIFQALFTGKLASPESLREMKKLVRVPGDHPPFVTPSYGLGLMADPDDPLGKGPSYGHGGEGPGYTVHVSHWPEWDGGTTVSVFFNSDQCDAIAAMVGLLGGMRNSEDGKPQR